MARADGMRGGAVGGPHGAAFKYDLLTALGAHACRTDKHSQRLTLRLIVLITARYDWQRDALSTGQREIAALWAVDERTVKREIAKLRVRGWLVLRYPAARGRVACHGLGIATILADTRESWDAAGSDFVARLTGPTPEDRVGNVIPFPALTAGTGHWAEICRRFHATDPATHLAWIAPLTCEAVSTERLTLRAPSRFHTTFVRTHHIDTLLAHARAVLSDVTTVEFVGP